MSKLISIIVVLALIVVAFLLFKDKGVAPTELENGNEEVMGEMMEEENSSGGDAMEEEAVVIKEFSIDGAPFSFTPNTMTVNEGDTVRITFTNVNGMHDLRIDEFNAATRVLNTGESETITFVADKTGTFEFYCSVGNHRSMGMVGTLTVN